jgi:hypothetical protein
VTIPAGEWQTLLPTCEKRDENGRGGGRIHTIEGDRILEVHHLEDWATALRQLRD